MGLVRVLKGLLENENFFLTSPMEDFLGKGEWSRDNEYFTLRDGNIKRNMPYDEFMIDIRKDVTSLDKGDSFSFFIENEEGIMGILEENEISKEYLRIIYNDNFIQVYSSDNGLQWENLGGEYYGYNINMLQGFLLRGSKDFVLRDYKVYKNPYVTIQNFSPKTVVKLYNADKMLLKERIFKDDWTCEIFLDYNVNGYLEFYEDEVLILKSDVREFCHGDTYLFTTSNLQLIYKNLVLEDEVTVLADNIEMLTLRNPENKTVNDVKLKVINDNLDTILISMDNKNFYTELTVEEIKAYEDKYLYVKIIKNMHYRNFQVNDFEISIF